MGLIRFDGADIVVSNAAFADVGPSVARLGVPVGETLDEYEALRGAVDDIAERFRDVFERNIWRPFVAEGMSPERVPQITSDVSRLASLATSVVTSELHERFAAYAADYMTRATEQRSRES